MYYVLLDKDSRVLGCSLQHWDVPADCVEIATEDASLFNGDRAANDYVYRDGMFVLEEFEEEPESLENPFAVYDEAICELYEMVLALGGE